MVSRLRTYASFIRVSHSVFALPFALAGALLAAQHTAVTRGTIGWILAAMVAARSAAMGFNRLVDARMDALNPRTAMREIPRGETRSYTEVARAIGRPKAARAVAMACAANPTPLVVPCHRVIHADGTLSGFRWGIARKKQLLEREKQ